MNTEQVLSSLYSHLISEIPERAYDLIIENDIRVENFFSINTGVYLDNLVKKGDIKSFQFQHTILLENPRRVHIDITFVDGQDHSVFLELKHFSISQNRGQGRGMSFYTSNSREGKKVGIIGDCEKLDLLNQGGQINKGTKLVCCAFITPKPTSDQIDELRRRVSTYPELSGWDLTLPIDFLGQKQKLGIITLQKLA